MGHITSNIKSGWKLIYRFVLENFDEKSDLAKVNTVFLLCALRLQNDQ